MTSILLYQLEKKQDISARGPFVWLIARSWIRKIIGLFYILV